MTDCIFYGGKGGVGKTTCAAATAVRLTDAGRRTLVVSTDPAHSLSDSLETDLGPEPRRLEIEAHDSGTSDAAAADGNGDAEGGLWAVEIDPDAQKERYEKLARALATDLRSAGIRLDDEEVRRLFASGAPAGSDEIAALDLLVEYVSGDWDVVVFDTAPTGHTLRLFDMPEVMGLALETAQSLRGQAKRIGNAARTAVLGPMSMMGSSRDDEEESLEAFRDRLERARDLLTDPERTEFRVVLLPEGMAIAESERLVETLREADVRVDRLVVNRVFEDPEEGCSRCHSRHERHLERVAEIRETFPDLEVVTLPEREGEVQGLEAVAEIGERLPDEA